MSEAISLGWNCNSAIQGVALNVRSTKQNGYKTCVFDEMITNYNGVIDCITDNFKYLCDIKYLELIRIPKKSKWLNTSGDGDMMIYNNKYKFLFNHESPGHANLFASQKWAKGINHFVLNNYKEFIDRYQRRIQNMKDLLKTTKLITFILTRPNTELININKMNDVIKEKYPLLNFKFLILNCDKHIFYDHMILMRLDKNDEELKRLAVE